MSDGTIRAAIKKEESTKAILKPASWMANIDFVNQLILSNNILVSFLGEQGSGKTAFAKLLQASLPKNLKSFLMTANPLVDSVTFIQQLGILLGEENELSIERFVARINEQKTHTLLIIDDAHFLLVPLIEEILKALHQQDQGGYFHVCLLSNFSLVSTYNKLAQEKYSDMIHSIELGSLSENETKAYVIQNLLPVSGAEKLVTDERIKQFYQLTAGHIEAVNRQMANFFNYKPATSLYKIKQLRQVSLVAGIFLVATASVYFWLVQDIQPPAAELASIRLESPALQIEPQLVSKIPFYNIAAVRQLVQATSLRRIELADSSEGDSEPDESMVVMDKVVVAPKVVIIKDKEISPEIKQPKPAVIKVTAKPRITTTSVKSAGTKGRYTIQLLASHNKAKLQHFAAMHHFKGTTTIHRVLRKGKNWYVLTLGVYPKRQQAKQIVQHLPRNVAQFKPWVRLISELKVG